MVSWPEIQDYMEHPRWNECIFCTEIEGHPCPDNTYMIPEDLYNNKFVEKTIETNLGKILFTEYHAVLNDKNYYYNRLIRRDDKVLLYDKDNDKYVITSCIGFAPGSHYLFEDRELLLGKNCDLIGSYNVSNFEYA